MRTRIARYRRTDPNDRSDFAIGCRILTQPFFFEEANWIAVPPSWSPNIVSFKTYNTGDAEGMALWEAVNDRLNALHSPVIREAGAQFGEPQLLPALEAAHIRPYGEGGEHEPRNGLLLRRDIHSLFDAGYVTVTPSLHFEVSRQIKEEFENGRDYYALHGQKIRAPEEISQRPDPVALTWHNEHCFKG